MSKSMEFNSFRNENDPDKVSEENTNDLNSNTADTPKNWNPGTIMNKILNEKCDRRGIQEAGLLFLLGSARELIPVLNNDIEREKQCGYTLETRYQLTDNTYTQKKRNNTLRNLGVYHSQDFLRRPDTGDHIRKAIEESDIVLLENGDTKKNNSFFGRVRKRALDLGKRVFNVDSIDNNFTYNWNKTASIIYILSCLGLGVDGVNMALNDDGGKLLTGRRNFFRATALASIGATSLADIESWPGGNDYENNNTYISRGRTVMMLYNALKISESYKNKKILLIWGQCHAAQGDTYMKDLSKLNEDKNKFTWLERLFGNMPIREMVK